MNVADYPKDLKSSEWQKEKSIIAKVLPGKKTGISEALAACESTYPAFKQAFSQVTAPGHVAGPVKDAAVRFAFALQHARDVAKEAATKWNARTSPVPKDTRIHAENVYKAAEHYNRIIMGLIG
jgi:hypothetical protein